jgi:hypothetical protein
MGIVGDGGDRFLQDLAWPEVLSITGSEHIHHIFTMLVSVELQGRISLEKSITLISNIPTISLQTNLSNGQLLVC